MSIDMPTETREALDRLVKTAEGYSGQCARCADFLLAWWNASSCGGFDLTHLWNLDSAICEDMFKVTVWLADNRYYPDDPVYRPRFEAMVRRRRPELFVPEAIALRDRYRRELREVLESADDNEK